MKQKISFSLIFILFIAILVVGCDKVSEDKNILENKSENDLNQIISLCDKEENCCVMPQDCKYIWFTGECNTQEYVSKRLKEAEDQGMHIGEAPPGENITCTCENNKCITHR